MKKIKYMREHLIVINLLILGILAGIYQPMIALSQVNEPGLQLHGSKALQGPEQLNYSIYFRWGIIKGKAAEATISTRQLPSKGQWFQQLHLRTTGIFESIFPMRDTMETLYNAKHQPLRWEKRVDEGGSYLVDVITYTHMNDGVKIQSRRYDTTEVKIDTTFVVPNSKAVVDMFSTIALARNIDPAKVKPGYKIPFVVVIGKSKVDGNLSYAGKDVMKIPGGGEIEAIRMDVNVEDPAFQSSTRSAEVWLTNDSRLLPLKIKAKLKVGYAECTLESFS